MRNYENPFSSRASEQERDPFLFLRHFGVGVIDLLPPSLWDRLVILRSAPGGGKTSLMRLFTAECLSVVAGRSEDLGDLAERLTALRALSNGRPSHLGVIMSLDRDYKALVDVGVSPEVSLRLFFHLLDARVMVAVIRAALSISRASYPTDVGRLSFAPREGAYDAVETSERLGGFEAKEILDASRRVENSILEALDALRPEPAVVAELGHSDLYSLQFLSDVELRLDGDPIPTEPHLMFDDGHELSSHQRSSLLRRLRSRDLGIPRWYSERFEALGPVEVLTTGDIKGRDYELLELESAARQSEGRRFDKVLMDIADRRSSRLLQEYSGTSYLFSDLARVNPESYLDPAKKEDLLKSVQSDTQKLVERDGRYTELMAHLPPLTDFESAIRWRELAIVIERDLRRPAKQLFEIPLTSSEANQLGGSDVRGAARLFLARDYNLPYYAGPDTLAKLGSHNIEQFLSLCGELFQEMLASITLDRRPDIAPSRQDAILKKVSRAFLKDLPRRLRFGSDVAKLVEAIGGLSKDETFRPTAPYAPGVTGTALTMRDRSILLDPDQRQRFPGADSLMHALSSAIAYNVISAELNRPVKGDRFMVLYLNRLLCPAFDLPLERGGFRERRLSDMIKWVEGGDTAQVAAPNSHQGELA